MMIGIFNKTFDFNSIWNCSAVGVKRTIKQEREEFHNRLQAAYENKRNIKNKKQNGGRMSRCRSFSNLFPSFHTNFYWLWTNSDQLMIGWSKKKDETDTRSSTPPHDFPSCDYLGVKVIKRGFPRNVIGGMWSIGGGPWINVNRHFFLPLMTCNLECLQDQVTDKMEWRWNDKPNL